MIAVKIFNGRQLRKGLPSIAVGLFRWRISSQEVHLSRCFLIRRSVQVSLMRHANSPLELESYQRALDKRKEKERENYYFRVVVLSSNSRGFLGSHYRD